MFRGTPRILPPMGFANRPSSDVPAPVHSRIPEGTLRIGAATHRCRVPSVRFLTASTGCSGARAPDVLQPGAGPGVRCVSHRRPRVAGGIPAARSHPSKVCSSSTAAPHRCGRCPLAVRTDSEALLHRRVQDPIHRCRLIAPRSFHGLRSPSRSRRPSLVAAVSRGSDPTSGSSPAASVRCRRRSPRERGLPTSLGFLTSKSS